MEPDVVRLYSSTPPPLDEGGEEEDEDEFGEFGGYCGGGSSSFSLSEFDTPNTFSQSYAAETSPPDMYITSVQSASSSGKNATITETEKLTENPQVSLAVTGVGIGDCENGDPEASGIIINGVPPSELQDSNTVQHSLASSSVVLAIQDFKDITMDQHRDRLGTAGGGYSHSSGHSKRNRGTEQEAPTVTSFNSTETGLEFSISPNPLSADNISQGEVSETGRTVADEVQSESQDFCTNKGGKDQSISESKEMQGNEVLSGLQGPSDEETFVSFSDPPPQGGSEDFGNCTESSVGLAAKVDEVSNTQLSKDFVDHNDTTRDPAGQLQVVVPSTELGGDFNVNGTTVDLTMELVHKAEIDKVLRKGKGNSGVPRIEMDEDFGDFRDAVQGFADFSRTDSAGFADFVTALSGCSTTDDFGDADSLKDLKEEEELPEEQHEDDLNTAGTWCSELPPSDSFADFSSAPLGDLTEDVGDNWVAFGLWGECEGQQKSWAAFEEGQQSNTATAPPCDSFKSDHVLGGLSCKLQHLFQSTFPSEVTPEVTQVETLQALLELQEHKENSCNPVQGEAAALWHHLLDTHNAHGLKVQWVGSRSNRILLDCLGIRNILFAGQKKRPLIVPMFAAGLGMLEPTKDPVKPSPASPAPLTPSSPGQGRSTLCTQQVASSLSSSEDGVDPELYELTTAKLECNNTSSNVADAFNRLMETVEKTSTVARKPERDGAISKEAARVISVLPDLSFMRARVLMFPSTLTPAANQL
ncbi:aftiphilin isoform X1 [Pygocentrus nattereri]|uniref:Aftiphilin clathrin-binding box domain-containing protein n=1 Tax=Pygocentrus nattereri TaxID=42514 RepID=A0A3B4EKX5_PYGNA|nr:aftiphilin isoform X1 [Pygocentrus nattereri]